MARRPKRVGFLIGVAAVSASAALAHAGTGLRSCSDEHQTSVYRAPFIKDQSLRGPTAAATTEHSLYTNLRERLAKQDAANQSELDIIVTACGWPQDSPFENSKLEAAFLVVQHSQKVFTERYRGHVEASYARGVIPQRRMDDFRRYVELKDRWSK